MKNLFVLSILMSVIFLFSCNMDDELQSMSELLTEKEEAIITNDAAIDDVSEELDYEIDFFTGSNNIIEDLGGNSNSKKLLGPWVRYLLQAGPDITVEPEEWVFPKTITLDYGDGVELINGRIISGKVIVELSNPPLTNGATRTIGFDEFYIDTVHIEGAGVRTFTGTAETERVFDCQSEYTFTFPDGDVLTRTGQRTRTFAEGFETVYDISDDLFTITGQVEYATEGETFSRTIINPLIKTGTCRLIVEGTVLFTYNDEDFAELDYGDGTCDDIATITKEGETIQITIGHRRRFRRN